MIRQYDMIRKRYFRINATVRPGPVRRETGAAATPSPAHIELASAAAPAASAVPPGRGHRGPWCRAPEIGSTARSGPSKSEHPSPAPARKGRLAPFQGPQRACFDPGEPPSSVFVAGGARAPKGAQGGGSPRGSGGGTPHAEERPRRGLEAGGSASGFAATPFTWPPAGGLFMVLGMPGGKGRLRPWAEARLRAVGAGGAKPQEAAGSHDYRRNKYRREKYRGNRAKS